MTLVWTKSAGPAIERSTWLSAAKWTMARGLCFCSSCLTSSRSQMSPLTKTWRESARSASRLRGLPAYVSLSRLTIGSPVAAMHNSTKFEPMKPAPPVTNSMRRLSLMQLRQPQPEKQRGENAVLVVQRGVEYAHARGYEPRAGGAAPQEPVVVGSLRRRPIAQKKNQPGRQHGEQRRCPDEPALGKR